MAGLTVRHALGIVDRQRYQDEALMRVAADEITLESKYNARLVLEPESDRKYAGDFLAILGKNAVRSRKRIISLGFIGLEGKPLGITFHYRMNDNGLLLLTRSKDEAGYLLGAGRAIDGFLNSILDTSEIESEYEEVGGQLQLVM